MAYPVSLRGERVLLREFRVDDLDAVHEWSSDPETVRLLRWGPNDRAATDLHLRDVVTLAKRQPRRDYSLGIVLVETGELVGSVSLRMTDREGLEATIGYVLRRDCTGSGLMTEAVRLVLEFGFSGLGLRRISATCDPENAASRRVLEKAGMRFLKLIEDHVRIRGEWHSSLLYVDDRIEASS